MTFSGFGVPFVCGDGSLVSPNFTIQQTALVGGQTQEQVDQDLESSWRLFLDIANQQLATACPKNP
jgi:hypothetical protein